MNEKEISVYVGSKIKYFRKKKGITQNELGKMLNVKNNTISAYERGVVSTDQDILFRLADIFDISINDFFPHNESVELTESTEYTYFPTAISAGLPLEVDGITDSKKIAVSDEFLGKWKSHKDIFFARISGDSMDKLMPDGSLIAIKPVHSIEELRNGDIVVYSLNGEYSVKKYIKQGDTIIFKPKSYNDAHFDQVYNADDDINIHGIVVTYVVNR